MEEISGCLLNGKMKILFEREGTISSAGRAVFRATYAAPTSFDATGFKRFSFYSLVHSLGEH